MNNFDPSARIRELEHEVSRLRSLLDGRGLPSSLRHQVRNALGLMRSILRRSAESSGSVEDYAAHLEGRFDALLRVQGLLISGTSEGADLRTILTNELTAHLIREDEQATVSGPDVRVPDRLAEVLGLVFHELATNAIKFGAMTSPKGSIEVSWAIETDPREVRLSWLETGMSDLPPEPAHRGFGLDTMIRLLNYQFEARTKFAFRPQGLQYRLEFTLPPPSTP